MTNSNCDRRTRQTKAESPHRIVLRSCLLRGLRFRRQHPIPPLIGAFGSIDRQGIIELDGDGRHWKHVGGRFSNSRTRSSSDDAVAVVMGVAKRVRLHMNCRRNALIRPPAPFSPREKGSDGAHPASGHLLPEQTFPLWTFWKEEEQDRLRRSVALPEAGRDAGHSCTFCSSQTAARLKLCVKQLPGTFLSGPGRASSRRAVGRREAPGQPAIVRLPGLSGRPRQSTPSIRCTRCPFERPLLRCRIDALTTEN
ncbi:MAG: DUF559 domain-containing protein [Planctomycetaceae bacterium]